MTAILGSGVVSAAGLGAEALARAVRGEIQPTIETQEFSFAEGATTLRVACADPAALENYVPKRKLRRLDRFSRMALLAAHQAVEDAGVELADRSRVGVVLGTGYGPTATTFAFQDGLIDDGDKCASPTHFANSVHNAMASQVSIQLSLTGPCHTLTCFGDTTHSVLLTAQLWLERGMVDYVLAGVGDEHCAVRSAAAAKARQEKRALGQGPVADESLPLGEGFAAWLLGAGDSAEHCARLEVVTEESSISKAVAEAGSLAGVLVSANDDVRRPARPKLRLILSVFERSE